MDDTPQRISSPFTPDYAMGKPQSWAPSAATMSNSVVNDPDAERPLTIALNGLDVELSQLACAVNRVEMRLVLLLTPEPENPAEGPDPVNTNLTEAVESFTRRVINMKNHLSRLEDRLHI